MCAVIGALIKNPSSVDFTKLEAVFHESKIRGMHATGIAYVKNNRVHIEKHPVPADQFPFNFKEYLNEDGNLYLIGHCRYSTSDLEYNQPLGNSDYAIAHNGVITQEPPEKWKELYNADCMTKNDSELVLHSDNPLVDYSHMSMGVAEIKSDKRVRFYRNGKRPLYLTSLSNGYIVTSTADIPKRAGLYFPTVEVPMNIYMILEGDLSVHLDAVTVLTNQKDYQHYAKTTGLHPNTKA